MTAATINKINRELAPHGVALARGVGYFYFYDLDGSPNFYADHIPSVFSCHLRAMSLEDWIDHAVRHIARAKA